MREGGVAPDEVGEISREGIMSGFIIHNHVLHFILIALGNHQKSLRRGVTRP